MEIAIDLMPDQWIVRSGDSTGWLGSLTWCSSLGGYNTSNCFRSKSLASRPSLDALQTALISSMDASPDFFSQTDENSLQYVAQTSKPWPMM